MSVERTLESLGRESLADLTDGDADADADTVLDEKTREFLTPIN